MAPRKTICLSKPVFLHLPCGVRVERFLNLNGADPHEVFPAHHKNKHHIEKNTHPKNFWTNWRVWTLQNAGVWTRTKPSPERGSLILRAVLPLAIQVPPQKVRLDPPGTHPSPTFSEGTTGSLGFLFLSALAFWPLTTRILLPPTGPYSHPRNPTHTLLLEEIRSVFIRLQIRCRSDSRSIQHLLPGKYVG